MEYLKVKIAVSWCPKAFSSYPEAVSRCPKAVSRCPKIGAKWEMLYSSRSVHIYTFQTILVFAPWGPNGWEIRAGSTTIVFPLTSSTTYYNMVPIGGEPSLQPQPELLFCSYLLYKYKYSYSDHLQVHSIPCNWIRVWGLRKLTHPLSTCIIPTAACWASLMMLVK